MFQDRYKSEAVEDDRYLLTVIRYIHQTPIKAEVKRHIEEYPWSSYNEYLGQKGICDTKYTLSLFLVEEKTAISLFQKYNTQKNNNTDLAFMERMALRNLRKPGF